MKFIAGLVVGILLFPLAVYCYFRFGYAPVSTSSSPIPFERKLAGMGLHARINREYPRRIPFQATDNDLQNGAHLYRQHCAACHGLPQNPETAIAKGMYPRPPQLFEKGKGVTDDEAGETYWKVANGIRLTGMPAYRGNVSDHDMWSISQLLAGADKLPGDVQTILREPVHEP